MQRTPIKRDIDAIELLEWGLEMDDKDCAATQIAGASVPIGIRRKAPELLEVQNALSGLVGNEIADLKHNSSKGGSCILAAMLH